MGRNGIQTLRANEPEFERGSKSRENTRQCAANHTTKCGQKELIEVSGSKSRKCQQTGEKITRENVNMPDLETARICIVKNTTLKKVMSTKRTDF